MTMKVAEAREMLRRELTERGLQRIRHPYSPKMWCRSLTEVTPSFSPDVCRRGGGVYILGGIGVYVTEFERLWARLVKTYCPNDRWDNSDLFGSDLWDLGAFRNAPPVMSDSEAAVQREQQWIDKILFAMDGLPSRLPTLLLDLKRGRVGLYPLRSFGGNFIRRRVFLRWLAERGYDLPEIDIARPRALISTPLEPILRKLEETSMLDEM
mgnify:CR=1 FL=1|tara:strand:+ start:74 stop:703 length:630 start_codon:yes stop_codon:yes gene_type:complete